MDNTSIIDKVLEEIIFNAKIHITKAQMPLVRDIINSALIDSFNKGWEHGRMDTVIEYETEGRLNG